MWLIPIKISALINLSSKLITSIMCIILLLLLIIPSNLKLFRLELSNNVNYRLICLFITLSFQLIINSVLFAHHPSPKHHNSKYILTGIPLQPKELAHLMEMLSTALNVILLLNIQVTKSWHSWVSTWGQ